MRWVDIQSLRLLLGILLVSSTLSNCADKTLLSKEQSREIKKKYGSFGIARIEAAIRLTNKVIPMNERKKLDLINNFVNKVRFTSDQRAWGG